MFSNNADFPPHCVWLNAKNNCVPIQHLCQDFRYRRDKHLVDNGKNVKNIWWITAFCDFKFGGMLFLDYIRHKN